MYNPNGFNESTPNYSGPQLPFNFVQMFISSPVVVDTQPISLPLQTLSGGTSVEKDFAFLLPISFLKARVSVSEEASYDCCSATSQTYAFVDQERNLVFQMVEDLTSKSGLLHTLRNSKNEVIGQVRLEFEESSCCSSYSYSIERQTIHITSSGGYSLGTIVMHTTSQYEIKNGMGEVIMELKPKSRFLSKTTYPLTSNDVTVANAVHGARSTSMQMPKDFSPIVKVLMAVLLAWLNLLKRIEDARSTTD